MAGSICVSTLRHFNQSWPDLVVLEDDLHYLAIGNYPWRYHPYFAAGIHQIKCRAGQIYRQKRRVDLKPGDFSG